MRRHDRVSGPCSSHSSSGFYVFGRLPVSSRPSSPSDNPPSPRRKKESFTARTQGLPVPPDPDGQKLLSCKDGRLWMTSERRAAHRRRHRCRSSLSTPSPPSSPSRRTRSWSSRPTSLAIPGLRSALLSGSSRDDGIQFRLLKLSLAFIPRIRRGQMILVSLPSTSEAAIEPDHHCCTLAAGAAASLLLPPKHPPRPARRTDPYRAASVLTKSETVCPRSPRRCGPARASAVRYQDRDERPRPASADLFRVGLRGVTTSPCPHRTRSGHQRSGRQNAIESRPRPPPKSHTSQTAAEIPPRRHAPRRHPFLCRRRLQAGTAPGDDGIGLSPASGRAPPSENL